MGGGAWWAAEVHGVTKSRARLSSSHSLTDESKETSRKMENKTSRKMENKTEEDRR